MQQTANSNGNDESVHSIYIANNSNKLCKGDGRCWDSQFGNNFKGI